MKEGNGNSSASRSPVVCEQVQELLFDYMAHELDDRQSLLVREHLMRCDVCRRKAAVLEKTLSLLRSDTSFAPPAHLKSAIRRRLERVFLHPTLDFIYLHRQLVAAVLAILIVAALAFAAGRYSRVKPEGRQLWLSPIVRPPAGAEVQGE